MGYKLEALFMNSVELNNLVEKVKKSDSDTSFIFNLSAIRQKEFISGSVESEVVDIHLIDPYFFIRKALLAHPEWQTPALRAFLEVLNGYDYLGQALGLTEEELSRMLVIGGNKPSLAPYHRSKDLVGTLSLVHQKDPGDLLNYLPSDGKLTTRCFGHGLAAYLSKPDFNTQQTDIESGADGYLQLPEPSDPSTLEICIKEHLTELEITEGIQYIEAHAPCIFAPFEQPEQIAELTTFMNNFAYEHGAFNLTNVFAWVLEKRFGIHKMTYRQIVASVTEKNFGFRTSTDKDFLNLDYLKESLIKAIPVFAKGNPLMIQEMQEVVEMTSDILVNQREKPEIQALIAGSYNFGFIPTFEDGHFSMSNGNSESLKRVLTYILLQPRSFEAHRNELMDILLRYIPQSEHDNITKTLAHFDDKYPLDTIHFTQDWRIGLDAHGLIVYILYRKPETEFTVQSAGTIYDYLSTIRHDTAASLQASSLPIIELKDIESIHTVLDMLFDIYLDSICFDELVNKERFLYREFDFNDSLASTLLYEVSRKLSPQLFQEDHTKEWFGSQMNIRFASLFQTLAQRDKTCKTGEYSKVKSLFWLKTRELLFNVSHRVPAHFLVDNNLYPTDLVVPPLDRAPLLDIFKDFLGSYTTGTTADERPISHPRPYSQDEISRLLQQEFLYRNIDLDSYPSILQSLHQLMIMSMGGLRKLKYTNTDIEWELMRSSRRIAIGSGKKRKVIPEITSKQIPELAKRLAERVFNIKNFSIRELVNSKLNNDMKATISQALEDNPVLVIVDSALFTEDKAITVPPELAVPVIGRDEGGNFFILDPLRPSNRNVRMIEEDKLYHASQGKKIFLFNQPRKRPNNSKVELIGNPSPTTTHIIIPDDIYTDFEQVNNLVAGEIASNHSNTVLNYIVEKRQRMQGIYKSLGIGERQPIMRGNNGGIIFLHHSTTLPLEQIKSMLSQGFIDQRPWKSKANWGDRCFGPSIAFYTDTLSFPLSVQENSSSVVGLEVFFENNKIPVLIKQAYWQRNLDYVVNLIANNRHLRNEWEAISAVFNTNERRLQKVIEGRAAFALTGALIDLLHISVDPSITRAGYRSVIQQTLQLPFGLRTYTDPRFCEPDELRKTVQTYIEQKKVTRDKEEKMMQIAEMIIREREAFMCSEEVTIDAKGNLQLRDRQRSLLQLFFMNNPDIKEILHNGQSNSVKLYSMLDNYADGFNPFGTTKHLPEVLPSSPAYLGTDLLFSNSVGLVSGALNRRQYRLLDQKEIESLFAEKNETSKRLRK